MVRAIEALALTGDVAVLADEHLDRLNQAAVTVVLARDEVSDVLATRLPDATIVYEDVFLRWDRPLTLAETAPVPDRAVSEQEVDRLFMEHAAREAKRSGDWWRQVGAVATRDGAVLFTGFNKHHPSEHAVYAVGNPRDNFDAGEHLEISDTIHGEASIVAMAARDGVSLRGASVYVTTFPCINCARLLAEAGVQKVYYRDGYSRLDAEVVLKDHGIEVIQVR
jgi:dCMP deaminase